MLFDAKKSFPNKTEPIDVDMIAADLENPDSKSRLSERNGGRSGSWTTLPSNPTQELTLRYMCENNTTKLGVSCEDNFSLDGVDKSRFKGKQTVSDDLLDGNQRCIERDFLQLGRGGSSENNKSNSLEKRGLSNEGHFDIVSEKRTKVDETLNLSLDPPNLSLSLNSSNPSPPRLSGASAAIKRSLSNSTFNTQATSGDFAMSRSQSCSHPFSHNPSCSLTHNSTSNNEYSRETDHIWYAGGGEGTNGSVHSRFKPIIGDGSNNHSVTFSNQNGHPRFTSSNNKEVGNGFPRINSFDNTCSFPSELPAQSQKEQSNNAYSDGIMMAAATSMSPEKILRQVLSGPIPTAARMLQGLPADFIESTKDYLRNIMTNPTKQHEFSNLQRQLKRRSDLTLDTLLKSHRSQLEMLVAVKTGLENYLTSKNRLPTTELSEIFLLSRCKNIKCKSSLPVHDCECKICSNQKGFCNHCMCPVCMEFDCAENTCSWVGCDVCSHWCHAICGIQKNLIRPGHTSTGSKRTTDMQFHCPGCNHASEMFGFVKEVFICCAKNWGIETLKKELDCVRRIFHASEDSRGKQLKRKAEEVLVLLDKQDVSPAGACDILLQFLQHGASDSSSKDEIIAATPLGVIYPKPTILSNITSSLGTPRNMEKPSLEAFDPTAQVSLPMKADDGFESLESMVKFKQAEAAMFQRLADDAQREVEVYQQISRVKSEKLEEEEYNSLHRLCLQETENKRRMKVEELRVLEDSQCDYYKMKMRMEAEMATLLERMEATKTQWSS